MGDRKFSVFVGNLDYKVIQGDLEDVFKGLRISNVHIVRDRETDQPKGFGYVEFYDQESVDKALEFSGCTLFDRELNVSLPRQRENRNNSRQGYNQNRGYQNENRGYNQRESREYGMQRNHEKLEPPQHPPFTAFVGNFDFNVTEQDLRGLFENERIDEIRVMRDRETGAPKGRAYIDFSDRESLIAALNADNFEWLGRRLRVDVANQKKNDSVQGGDRGSGGFDNFSRSNMRQSVAVERPGEFTTLTAEEEEERKRKMAERRAAAAAPAPTAQSEAPVVKKKEDPFGGAKARDEKAFQERMGKLAINSEKK